MKLMDGNSIFLKYWIIGEPLLSDVLQKYYISIIPGMKEGISGSILSGNNIGIIKNIAEDRKEAALEVLKFFTSKDYQKEKFKANLLSTGIDELLNDEEACENGICDLAKAIQYTVEPEFIKDQSEDYSKRYQKYIYQYLYENKTIEETLKKIKDITDIYYIALNTENSYIGLVCFIFFSILSILMLLSLIFIIKENFRPYVMFLPEDLWIITVLGSVLILWIPFISYGPVNTLKCHVNLLLLSIGYTLSVCPTMYKLIARFPEDNKLIIWIYKHKYLFLLFNILIDGLMNSVFLIKLCTSQKVLIEDGESFEKCKYNGEYSFILLMIYKFIVIALILFLVFVEWNNPSTKYDMRFIILALYIDILSIILIYVFHVIKIKNYKLFFLVQAINTTTISLSNYLFLFGFRILLGLIRKQSIKLELINRINDSFINNETQLQSKTCSSSSNNNKNDNNNNNNFIYKSNVMNDNGNTVNSESLSSGNKTNFITRMISYHYSSKLYISSSSNIAATNTFNN